jgi:hypothetical protein
MRPEPKRAGIEMNPRPPLRTRQLNQGPALVPDQEDREPTAHRIDPDVRRIGSRQVDQRLVDRPLDLFAAPERGMESPRYSTPCSIRAGRGLAP